MGLMSRFSGEVMPSKSLAWRLVCLLGFASTICLSGRGQVWDFLGDAQIDGTRDHDRIQVTRRDGVFHTIQLRVSGDPIFLDRVVVHFGDGKWDHHSPAAE